MAANMWKNSLKNVQSDNNKILYETLLDFFYSETVLIFWISLIISVHKNITTTHKFQEYDILVTKCINNIQNFIIIPHFV